MMRNRRSPFRMRRADPFISVTALGSARTRTNGTLRERFDRGRMYGAGGSWLVESDVAVFRLRTGLKSGLDSNLPFRSAGSRVA